MIMRKITGQTSNEDPNETKHISLEGVYMTLQDTNLTLPSQVVDTKRDSIEKFNSIEARL